VTTLIIVLVVIVVVIALAAFLVLRKNREANVARAEQLRAQVTTQAPSTIAPARERAAAAEAEAEQARAAAARAEAEAHEARLAAQQVEATHEGQVRAADRLDPRVDHKAEDYTPQVPGTADHDPTPPTAVEAEHSQPTKATGNGRPPLLPRRTPGANDMPGKPIEQTDGGGGWFTKGSDKS
jgi:FtsZ-interacting cell division protein ZipA